MGECLSLYDGGGDQNVVSSRALIGLHLKDADAIVQQRRVMHRAQHITALWPCAPQDVPDEHVTGRLYVVCPDTAELIESVQS